MKIKYYIIPALILILSAFLFPTRAYAAEVVTPPTVEASIVGETLRIEAQSGFYDVEAVFINDIRFNFRVDSILQVDLSAFRDTETIAVYAMDFAGNVSNIVTLENPLAVSTNEPDLSDGIPVQSMPSDVTEEVPAQPNPFTPDGQATVLDHATEGDNKEFFTFTTPAGNVFFLIIDHDRPNDNVYFLNAVTEQDLIALAEQSGVPIENDIGGIPVATTPTVPSDTADEESPREAEAPPPAQSGGSGTMLFILIGVAAIGGAGYYMKIVRPKKQAADDYDDEDEDEQDLGEEMKFMDEPKDDDDEIETEDDGL